MSGSSLLLWPMFTEIYPWFLLFRLMNNVGTLIGTDAPFLPDYFDANSAGLASGYLIICSTISGLIGSSFVQYLGSKLSDIRWIFYGLGIITIFFAFILSCGLKDVERGK